MQVHLFTKILLEWYNTENKRVLPWKNETDPYKIWLSETILQQTKAEQGVPYYLKFLKRYPTLKQLAKAKEEEVLKLWEGLGYYSRARNLLVSANLVLEKHNGIFPNDYKEILALKGVGKYTASAIASFAYKQPYPAIDGNFKRIITRYFGIETCITLKETENKIEELAHILIKNTESQVFNQAMMDFGASICTPKPKCNLCPHTKRCFAFNKNKIKTIPLNTKKITIKKRYMNFVILLWHEDNAKYTAIEQRTKNDIWQGLHQFINVEDDTKIASTKLLLNKLTKMDQSINIGSIKTYKNPLHKLTHQHIYSNTTFIHLEQEPKLYKIYRKIKVTELKKIAFPKILISGIEKLYLV